ncbi:MAG: hypothetical protein M1832_000919 [Thelocarpon impressellum]|nr:MAG: hypothetical protein M1832_000919 [Thelocarpon impressellum]
MRLVKPAQAADEEVWRAMMRNGATSGVPEADRLVQRNNDVVAWLADASRGALRQGGERYSVESCLMVGDWGLDLAAVARNKMVRGILDGLGGTAQLRVNAAQGHVSLHANYAEDILAHLLDAGVPDGALAKF